jgi:hypothetical protein
MRFFALIPLRKYARYSSAKVSKRENILFTAPLQGQRYFLKAAETMISVATISGYNSQACILIDVAHLVQFLSLQIIFLILDNTERVDPKIFHSQQSG